MSWAKVGMKVVCVDSRFVGVSKSPLRKGRVYTIKAKTAWCGNMGTYVLPTTSLFLAETRNPHSSNGGFAIERFRPLVTKTIEHDVQIFKRIADTVPSLEDAE